jgi:hypothetical protein
MTEHFVPDKVEVNLQSQELHFQQDVNPLVHPFSNDNKWPVYEWKVL